MVSCLLELPSGELVSGSGGLWDKKIRIWDLNEKKCMTILNGHELPITCLIFVQDLIASSSHDLTIKLWNKWSNECVRTLKGHSEVVYHLETTKNLLISCSGDKSIRFWSLDADSYECVRVLNCVHEASVCCIKVNPYNEDHLLSRSYDKTLRMWSITTGECLLSIQTESKYVFKICNIEFIDNVKCPII